MMTLIHEGAPWPTIFLRDVCQTGKPIVYGIVQPGPHVEDGVPYINSTDIGKPFDLNRLARTSVRIANQYKRAALEPGDVVVSLRGEIGSSSIIPPQLAGARLARGVARISVQECFMAQFVSYCLQAPHVLRKVLKASQGSALQEIPLGQLRKIELPLVGMEEQGRIVAVLSTWDRGIEEAERLLALKEQRKRALMQQLLTGKRRFPEFVRSKARIRTMFGTAPKDWPMRRFGDFLEESRQRGSDGETARKITVKLYGKGVIPKSEKRIGSESTQYFRRLQGQFIYSKLDFLNGAFGLVPLELDGYESTLDLPAFDIAPALDSTFLLSFVTRPVFYTRCIGYAMGGRKARRVPPEQFLSIEFPCPSLDEQRRIAAVLNTCDAELRLLRDQLVALKQQKKGLMQKLLTGEVRVPMASILAKENS